MQVLHRATIPDGHPQNVSREDQSAQLTVSWLTTSQRSLETGWEKGGTLVPAARAEHSRLPGLGQERSVTP